MIKRRKRRALPSALPPSTKTISVVNARAKGLRQRRQLVDFVQDRDHDGDAFGHLLKTLRRSYLFPLFQSLSRWRRTCTIDAYESPRQRRGVPYLRGGVLIAEAYAITFRTLRQPPTLWAARCWAPRTGAGRHAAVYDAPGSSCRASAYRGAAGLGRSRHRAGQPCCLPRHRCRRPFLADAG